MDGSSSSLAEENLNSNPFSFSEIFSLFKSFIDEIKRVNNEEIIPSRKVAKFLTEGEIMIKVINKYLKSSPRVDRSARRRVENNILSKIYFFFHQIKNYQDNDNEIILLIPKELNEFVNTFTSYAGLNFDLKEPLCPECRNITTTTIDITNNDSSASALTAATSSDFRQCAIRNCRLCLRILRIWRVNVASNQIVSFTATRSHNNRITIVATDLTLVILQAAFILHYGNHPITSIVNNLNAVNHEREGRTTREIVHSIIVELRNPAMRDLNNIYILIIFILPGLFRVLNELLLYIWRERYEDIVSVYFGTNAYANFKLLSILKEQIEIIDAVTRLILNGNNLSHQLSHGLLRMEHIQSIYCCFIVHSPEVQPERPEFNFIRYFYSLYAVEGRCMLWDNGHPTMTDRISEIASIRSIYQNCPEPKCPVCWDLINEDGYFVILNSCRHLMCVFCAVTLFSAFLRPAKDSRRCPLCRAVVASWTTNTLLERYLQEG